MSAVETVARVAALRERAARSQVAAASKVAVAARAAASARAAELSALRSPTPSRLVADRQIASLRAAAALAARNEEQAAQASRVTALAGWSAAADRRRALEDLLTRQRDEQQHARELFAQHEADERAAARRTVAAPW